jgi:4'-phosphopantetheinyl transferase
MALSDEKKGDKALSDIHVWHVQLDRPIGEAERLVAYLDPSERVRAARYRDPLLGRRFVIGRASLRRVLGQWLGRNPNDIRFTYCAAGKPELADADAADLYFNVTHSGPVALIALSPGRPVGIDVERVRPDFAGDEIAARFFSAREQEMLLTLPAAERIAAFFRCWTRKEAFIKLLGAGLAFPLDEFDVSLLPDLPARLLGLHGDAEAAKRFSMREIAAPPGYFAAVVVEGPISDVREFWDL